MWKRFVFWWHNTRWVSLPQSLLPALVAYFAAMSTLPGLWNLYGVLAILGVALLHLGMNLFDDYFDYRHQGPQVRDRLASEGIRARIAKCAYITDGSASPRQLLYAASAFCLAALIPGAEILANRQPFLLLWAFASALLAIQYSARPLRLSYHGLGELHIGLTFGPLLMIGVFFACTNTWNNLALFLSVPVGLLVTNIVYVHSIMDFEPDRRVGKKTLAVILNHPWRAWTVHVLLVILPFAIITTGALMNYISPLFLWVWLFFPMGCGLIWLMFRFTQNPKHDMKPQFWMGPMQQWKRIQEAQIEWFMIRWYTARNFMTFFCLTLIIVSICI